MKWILFLVFITSGLFSSAQRARFSQESSEFMADASGRPVYPQQKYSWEGNIFFPETYESATITSPDSKQYRNVQAKINLQENTLLYLDTSGQEYVTTMPLAKVEFGDAPGKPGTTFLFIQDDDKKGFYQLLDSGKTDLLKRITISYKDRATYGSTSITRVFSQNVSYFARKNNKISALDKTKPAMLSIFSDKSNRIDAFIEIEKIKLRKEEDMIKVFRFYNNLR